MNALSLHAAVAAVPTPADARASGRGLGLLLVAEALLAFAPVVVLGAAIGWPASLGLPAAEQLVAIATHADAVALGYGLYLLYSLLVAPVMVGLAARACGGLQHPLAMTVVAFAALSALARAIGILRWLTVMPALASAYAGADPATRTQIERLFDAVNDYGGGIGEILGVSLLMALSLGLLAVGALRSGSLPRWLAAAGAVVALMLAALALPALRIELQMPVAAAVSMLSLWMLCVGVWLLRRR
jgi:Domain of unknown function (DUF4386)